MKKLLVINKKINFFEKKKILSYIKSKKIIILDINYDQNKEFYERVKILNNIIKYNFFFEKNFYKIKFLYEKKIRLFLRDNPNYILFKFSEINFSDFWWKLIFNVEAINIFCQKNGIKEVNVFEKINSYLSQSLFHQKNKKYLIKRKYNLALILYRIYLKKICYSNLLKEIFSNIRCIIINNKNFFKKKNYIYTSFPQGWTFLKKPRNRFLGNKISNNSCYLFSINRSNQYKLNLNYNLIGKLDGIRNYCILESYASITNILKNYLFLFENKKNIFQNLNTIFENNFVSNILTYGIIYVEKPKNNVFINNLRQFHKYNKVKKIIHTIPEFIDGRIINKFFNELKVNTFSAQHSSIGVLQSSRFIFMLKILDKINKNFVSKKIFVENNIIKKQLKDMRSAVKIVGNVRISRKKLSKINNKENIYYIAEMHNINSLKTTIDKVLNIFKKKNLFIRVHPEKKNIQTKIILKLREYNKRLFIDKYTSITYAIKNIKPFLVFTSTPTVYSELTTNQIKTILIKDSGFFTNYPADINPKKVFSTINFNTKDYKGEIHKVPTKIFGKKAEDKIYNFFNE